MKREHLLAELEDLLRSVPGRDEFDDELSNEVLAWLARAKALVEAWDFTKSPIFDLHIRGVLDPSRVMDFRDEKSFKAAYRNVVVTLQQAAYDLRMKTVGPISVAIGAGTVFDYFDMLRKIVEGAQTDLFVIDPYLGLSGHPKPAIDGHLKTGH